MNNQSPSRTGGGQAAWAGIRPLDRLLKIISPQRDEAVELPVLPPTQQPVRPPDSTLVPAPNSTLASTPNQIMTSSMAMRTSQSESEGQGDSDSDSEISIRLPRHGPEEVSAVPAVPTGVSLRGSPNSMGGDDETNFQSPRQVPSAVHSPRPEGCHAGHRALRLANHIWQIVCIVTWLTSCGANRQRKN